MVCASVPSKVGSLAQGIHWRSSGCESITGTQVDGAILVVWAGQSNRNAVRLCVKLISEAKIKLCGVVLQRLSPPEMSSAYYSYYGKEPYGQSPDKPQIVKPEKPLRCLSILG